MQMLCGWIFANPEDSQLLESLGVEIGFYDQEFGGFEDCLICRESLANLLPYWGRFVWHFKPANNSILQRSAA